MNKWETLRLLMKADISHAVHYSADKNYEHMVTERYLKYMDELDEKEKKENTKQEGFLFTGVPDFNKKTWERMLKNLEGLS